MGEPYGVDETFFARNTLARAGHAGGYHFHVPAGSNATTGAMYAHEAYRVLTRQRVKRIAWWVTVAATSNANCRLALYNRRGTTNTGIISGTSIQLSKTKTSGKTLAWQSIGVASLAANMSYFNQDDSLWLSALQTSRGGGQLPRGITFMIETEAF